MVHFETTFIKTLRKSGKGGAFHTVHRIFFAPTYMTLGNGFKTLNIDNKVSWNIQKHIFIILKSKFEPFLDGQKIFPEGVLFTRSPRRPEKCHRFRKTHQVSNDTLNNELLEYIEQNKP